MRSIWTGGRATGRAAALLAALALGGGAVVAGPASRPGGPREAPPPAIDELRRAMERLMIERLRTALRLAPEQEGAVVPKVETLLASRREHAQRRRPALRRLRDLLRQEPPDQGRIRGTLEELRAAQEAFRGRETALREALFDDLSPWQQGRFLLFEQRFRRQMQRRLDEAAGRVPAGPRRPGPRTAPPAGDPLDDPAGGDEEPE